MNKDGTMARVPELSRFARRHNMPLITVADLITFRMRTESVADPARAWRARAAFEQQSPQAGRYRRQWALCNEMAALEIPASASTLRS
jgi:hypothetical protein